VATTWWSVLVEAAAGEDAKVWPDIEPSLLDGLMEALGVKHSGVVSGDSRSYSARISLDATDQIHGALWAVHTGCGIVVDAAMKVGLPDWQVVRVEAVRDDVLARELEE